MHFVHIEDFVHPDAGYQINLLTRLQVQQGHRVTIVTSETAKLPEYITGFFGTDRIEEKDQLLRERTGGAILRMPLLGFYSGRSIYYPKIFRIVDELRPDVLFVHGEDTLIGMQYIWRSNRLPYPLVLDCHMLEMASENRFKYCFRWFYRTFIAPRIVRHGIPLIRVVDSDYVQKCLGIPLKKTILLSFGTDTSYFKPNAKEAADFRREHNISPDDFVVLYAGKLDVYKGGEFLARSIEERIAGPDGRRIVFVIVGNAAGEYGQKVETLLSKSENRILRFSTQAYLNLGRFYQAADVAIYPKQCSMSFFEAQSCGVPVLFERNEINCQRVAGKNAIIFEPGDIVDLRAKIVELASLPAMEWSEMTQAARDYVLTSYDYVPIAQKFTDVMLTEAKRFALKKR